MARFSLGSISSKVYAWCVRRLLPPLGNIRDTQRGFKLFKREVIEKILPLAKDKTLSFDTELLLLSIINGYDIEEVPIHWYDSPQERKFNMFKESFRMLGGVIKQREHVKAYYPARKHFHHREGFALNPFFFISPSDRVGSNTTSNEALHEKILALLQVEELSVNEIFLKLFQEDISYEQISNAAKENPKIREHSNFIKTKPIFDAKYWDWGTVAILVPDFRDPNKKSTTRDEEIKLGKEKDKGNGAAWQTLAQINRRLPSYLLKKSKLTYSNELLSEGSLALMKAAASFDWKKGYRFSAYAGRSITRAFIRHERQQKRREIKENIIEGDVGDMQNYIFEKKIPPGTKWESEGIDFTKIINRFFENKDKLYGEMLQDIVYFFKFDDSITEFIIQEIKKAKQEYMELTIRKIDIEKIAHIVLLRLNASTLQETGKSFGISKEKVRQIEENVFSILNRRGFLKTLKEFLLKKYEDAKIEGIKVAKGASGQTDDIELIIDADINGKKLQIKYVPLSVKRKIKYRANKKNTPRKPNEDILRKAREAKTPGEAIKCIREGLGLGQRIFAGEIGVDVNVINGIERDQGKKYYSKTIKRIIEYLVNTLNVSKKEIEKIVFQGDLGGYIYKQKKAFVPVEILIIICGLIAAGLAGLFFYVSGNSASSVTHSYTKESLVIGGILAFIPFMLQSMVGHVGLSIGKGDDDSLDKILREADLSDNAKNLIGYLLQAQENEEFILDDRILKEELIPALRAVEKFTEGYPSVGLGIKKQLLRSTQENDKLFPPGAYPTMALFLQEINNIEELSDITNMLASIITVEGDYSSQAPFLLAVLTGIIDAKLKTPNFDIPNDVFTINNIMLHQTEDRTIFSFGKDESFNITSSARWIDCMFIDNRHDEHIKGEYIRLKKSILSYLLRAWELNPFYEYGSTESEQFMQESYDDPVYAKEQRDKLIEEVQEKTIEELLEFSETVFEEYDDSLVALSAEDFSMKRIRGKIYNAIKEYAMRISIHRLRESQGTKVLKRDLRNIFVLTSAIRQLPGAEDEELKEMYLAMRKDLIAFLRGLPSDITDPKAREVFAMLTTTPSKNELKDRDYVERLLRTISRLQTYFQIKDSDSAKIKRMKLKARYTFKNKINEHIDKMYDRIFKYRYKENNIIDKFLEWKFREFKALMLKMCYDDTNPPLMKRALSAVKYAYPDDYEKIVDGEIKNERKRASHKKDDPLEPGLPGFRAGLTGPKRDKNAAPEKIPDSIYTVFCALIEIFKTTRNFVDIGTIMKKAKERGEKGSQQKIEAFLNTLSKGKIIRKTKKTKKYKLEKLSEGKISKIKTILTEKPIDTKKLEEIVTFDDVQLVTAFIENGNVRNFNYAVSQLLLLESLNVLKGEAEGRIPNGKNKEELLKHINSRIKALEQSGKQVMKTREGKDNLSSENGLPGVKQEPQKDGYRFLGESEKENNKIDVVEIDKSGEVILFINRTGRKIETVLCALYNAEKEQDKKDALKKAFIKKQPPSEITHNLFTLAQEITSLDDLPEWVDLSKLDNLSDNMPEQQKLIKSGKPLTFGPGVLYLRMDSLRFSILEWSIPGPIKLERLPHPELIFNNESKNPAIIAISTDVLNRALLEREATLGQRLETPELMLGIQLVEFYPAIEVSISLDDVEEIWIDEDMYNGLLGIINTQDELPKPMARERKSQIKKLYQSGKIKVIPHVKFTETPPEDAERGEASGHFQEFMKANKINRKFPQFVESKIDENAENVAERTITLKNHDGIHVMPRGIICGLSNFVEGVLNIKTYMNGDTPWLSLQATEIKDNDEIKVKVKGDCTDETLEKVLDMWEDLLQDTYTLEGEPGDDGQLKYHNRILVLKFSLDNNFDIPENIEKNAKKVVALLTNALMMWTSKAPPIDKDGREESKERRVLAIDLGDVDDEVAELIYKYLIEPLKEIRNNNGQLEIILKDLHIIVGRGEKLKQRLDALMTQPKKNKLKKENTIIITPKDNLSIFDDFEGHAFITAFDDSELTRSGEKLAYYPIVEIAFFTLLRVLEGNNDGGLTMQKVDRLRKWYRRIPNIDLEGGDIRELCFDDDHIPRKTVILKLKDAVKFNHDTLETIYSRIQEFIKNA